MRACLPLLLFMWGNVRPAAALEIGDPVPDVAIADTAGRTVSLPGLRHAGAPFVVVFWGPDCPCSAACDDGLEALVRDPADRKLSAKEPRPAVVVIDPTSAPGERASIARDRKQRGLTVPIHFDHDRTAARRFLARTTPTTFVFDGAGHLAYRGAFERLADERGRPLEPTGGVVLRPVDPAHPTPPPVTWSFLHEAVRRLIDGQPLRHRWVQPAGCPVLHEPPLPPPSVTERTLFSE